MCDDVPCRYGFDCTCQEGRKVGKSSSYNGRWRRPDGVVCRSGSSCTRSDCCFLHPDGKPPQHAYAPRSGVPNISSAVNGSVPSLESTIRNRASQSQPKSSSCGSSVLVPCRYGLACRRRSTCKFRHPGDKVSNQITVTHSGRDRSTWGATMTHQSQQTASDMSSTEGGDGDWQEQQENADAELRQQRSIYTRATGTADVQAHAGTVYTWLAGSEPNMRRQSQQQQQSPGKACGEELVTVPQVGPALADYLRLCHGRELQGLRRLLSASQVLWLPGSSTLWASVPADTAYTARHKLLTVISAARTAISSHRLELPLIGGTRLLLLPGGGISDVLTRNVYITLSISDLPTTISEQQIRNRLSSFGCINWLQLEHNTICYSKERQQSVMNAWPASKTSWAQVMFEEPDQAAAALASAEQLLPWTLEAITARNHNPPSFKHTQGGLCLRVTWQVGRPTGSIYVQLASAETTNHVIRRCQQQVYKLQYGLSNVLSIDATTTAFVNQASGKDKCLLLKPTPPEMCMNAPCTVVLSKESVRTCLIGRCKIQPADIVSITPQHVLGGLLFKNGRLCGPHRRPLMQQFQQELEKMFQAHGALRHVSLPYYNPQTGQASAFISYQNIEAYLKAMASLSGQSGPKPCCSDPDKPMTVNVEYCTTLPVDACTVSAVKSQLEAAIAEVRTRLPDVTVTLLERPAAVAHSVMVGPVNKQAVVKLPSSSRQSFSTVGIPNGVCCESLVRLTGSSNEAVVAARAMLELAVAGRVSDGAGVGGVAALLTPAGKAFLQTLEREFSQQTPAKYGTTVSAVHIHWQQRNRLRLYGPDSKLDQVEAAIMQYLQGSQQPKGNAIRLPIAAYQRIAKGGHEALEALQQQSGADSIALDASGKGLVVEGTNASIVAAEAAAVGLNVCSHRDSQAIGKVAFESGTKQETCPVCMCDVDEPYHLAGCGHSYCTSCLTAMLSSATRNINFPVKCCAEGCASCICLPDLTHLLPAMELFAAYKAAFRAFVLANRDRWGCCPTADCPQVYQRGVARFECDCCLKSWCTLCWEPLHTGQSCRQNKAWKHAASRGDRRV